MRNWRYDHLYRDSQTICLKLHIILKIVKCSDITI